MNQFQTFQNNIVIKNLSLKNNSQKKISSKKRQNSVNIFYNNQKNEKIFPKKRIIKSREKEVKTEFILPLIIKKNSFSPNKTIDIPKSVQKSKKDSQNKLVSIITKKPIYNENHKNEIINNGNLTNNFFKNEINENNSTKYKYNTINNNNVSNLNNIIKFYEEFIELSTSIPNKNLFNSLLNNFNKKYLLHYSTNNSINNSEDSNFIISLKYSFIIISCLIFFSKDEVSHKFNNQRLKELVDEFIYVSLKKLKINPSIKIKSFINRMKTTKKVLTYCTNAIIKLLYNNKNEYTSLKNAFNQLATNINNFNLNDISNIINNSILYCFNFQFIKNKSLNTINANKNKKKNKFSKTKQEQNQTQVDELLPSAPYIKTKMEKKFCLVLDIDETITHTLKLPFGDYFLVRPGVKEFLKEMVKYFEIVIFTSSPKSYADNILDKIDINNEFFNYRLYRRHVIYENGNSVKKLDLIGRDLKKVVFVDNLKSNAKYNPDNLYHIKTWMSDITDNQLIELKNKLKNIVTSGQYDDDITKGLYNL